MQAWGILSFAPRRFWHCRVDAEAGTAGKATTDPQSVSTASIWPGQSLCICSNSPSNTLRIREPLAAIPCHPIC